MSNVAATSLTRRFSALLFAKWTPDLHFACNFSKPNQARIQFRSSPSLSALAYSCLATTVTKGVINVIRGAAAQPVHAKNASSCLTIQAVSATERIRSERSRIQTVN